VRLEGIDQLKNPMTSSGLEYATFRLVAQCPPEFISAFTLARANTPSGTWRIISFIFVVRGDLNYTVEGWDIH
jgi:hypothetical protein